MNKRTTYKKLILKIILLTLTISLSVAFLYAQYMKQNAIEKLTKVDAKKTTQLVFQSFRITSYNVCYTKLLRKFLFTRFNCCAKSILKN